MISQNTYKYYALMRRFLCTAILALSVLLLQAQSNSCLSFNLATQDGQPGDNICLDVTVKDFTNVGGFQYSIVWDADQLVMTDITNFNLAGLTSTSFNTTAAAWDAGYTAVSWYDTGFDGDTLTDGTAIFSLCFEVLSDPSGGELAVEFSDSPAAMEILDGDNFTELELYSFINGGLSSSDLKIDSLCLTFNGCVGTSEAAPSVSGGQPPYTYDWYDAMGNYVSSEQILPAGTSGLYSLVVTDVDGHTATAISQLGGDSNFNVSNANVMPAGCDGAATGGISLSVAGGSGDYSFSWSTGATDSSIVDVAAGDYSVTVTDNVSTCTTTALFTVPTQELITGHAYECTIFTDQPSTADITTVVWAGGTAPYTFDWSTGYTETADTLSVLAGVADSTAYSVTITSQEGCTAVVDIDAFSCEPTPDEFLTAHSYNCTVFTDQPSVADLTVVVWTGGVPPYTFDWSTGESTASTNSEPYLSTITVPGTGTYYVTITDAVGATHEHGPMTLDCDDTVFPIVTNVGVQCLSDTTAAVTVDISGGVAPYNISWDNGFQDNNIVSSTLSVSSNGTYSYTVTDATGTTYSPPGVIVDCGGTVPVPVQLSVDGAEVNAGDAFCLDLTVADFIDVISMQFSMAWDTGVIHFDTLLVGTALSGYTVESNFNLGATSVGIMSTQWFDPDIQMVTLQDSTILFTICFEAGMDAGVTNVSFTNNPTIIEIANTTAGAMNVNLIAGTVNVLAPEVWPGDTDVNGGVNHFDLLPIGLAFGSAGPPRTDPTTNWEAQYADDWGQTTPASAVDYKHMDTNGDGFVDEEDTLALSLNWGEETNFTGSIPPPDRSFNGSIFVQPDTLLLGAENVFDIILGSDIDPTDPVYGLAFTVVYDTAAVEPGTAYTTFGNSWLGTIDDDMISFHRDRYEDGRIDVALTRTDGLDVAGGGTLGQLHITIQDVIFMRNGNYPLVFDIENIRVIDHLEVEIGVTPQQTTSIIKNAILNTAAPLQQRLQLFPNPTSERLYIRTDAQVERVMLSTLTGQVLTHYGAVNEIDMSQLPAGSYLIRIWTNAGLTTHRVSVVK